MGLLNKDFTAEDVILYIFGIGIMIFIGFFLIQSQKNLELNIVHSDIRTDKEVATGKTEAPSQTINPDVSITKFRYQYASKILLSNSTRKNIAFLVGTLLTIFGCMIIIRGVRDSPFEGEVDAFERAKVKIKASSPGIVVVLCGTLILVLSIMVKDVYEIQDPIVGSSNLTKQGYGNSSKVILTEAEKNMLKRKP